MYNISWFPIVVFISTGVIILSLLGFVDWKEFSTNILTFIANLIVSSVFMGYGIYLLRKRREGKGYYWDDEGIVIDLKGNKVFWHEIEEIKYAVFHSSKSTVIHPHWRNHEKIAARHSRKMPTPGHSIDWFMVERAKEMHEELMKTWEENRPETNFFF
ncbi:hypothetical protein B0X71_11140 [Planococcus lenghuensis]|uniref:Uncharacterized protein n=2 Tax=Planococcus lenghuensis TaxID=2213202 RepID=A0A1Q2L3Q5_9BACL|nr:hypothetical protein B0X71_11140 [Planococcus lenghuensis]